MADRKKRERNQRTISTLLSPDLHAAVTASAEREGLKVSTWLRAVCSRAVGRKLDFESGYEEGRSAAWADVNQRVRAALERAFRD